MKSLIGLGTTALAAIVVALAAFAAMAGTPPSAEAKLLLSGDWNITFAGDVVDSCDVVIGQPDNTFTMSLSCPTVRALVLKGMVEDPAAKVLVLKGMVVDPAASTFVLKNESFVMEGSASAYDSMSGTWTSGVYSGTFGGERAEPQPFPWDIDDDGVVSARDISSAAKGFGELAPHDADVNSDGMVSAADISEVVAHFGETGP